MLTAILFFFLNGAPAGIRDGTSNTILFSERYWQALSKDNQKPAIQFVGFFRYFTGIFKAAAAAIVQPGILL